MTALEDTPRLRRLLGYLAADPANLRLRADVFDEALACGDFDECRRQAAWALAADPPAQDWRRRLALVAMAGGAWDEARAILEGLRDDGAHDAVTAYNLAYVDFAQGHLQRAEAQLAPLVERALAEVPQALAVLVSCRHRRRAPDEAVSTFEPFAARWQDAAAFGAASLAALDAEAADRAMAWCERALALDPAQQEALVAKATLLIAGRDAAGALQFASTALGRAPRDGRILATAAMAEMLAGRLPQAAALYARSVAVMPEHIGTWIGYGWCAIFQGDTALARSAFEAALALDPAFGESHGAMAVVLALEDRRDEAEEALRRARGLDRRGLSAEYARALLDGETRSPERFLERAQVALARHVGPGGRSLAELVLARR